MKEKIDFRDFKNQCICCEQSSVKMNKEHVYPLWLLEHTNNKKVPFSWPYGKIPADQCTIPLCVDCNTELSKVIESPMKAILINVENNLGFNDQEAEIIARWLWKMTGMFYWGLCDDSFAYGPAKLRDRVLEPICMPRSRICIGVSLINDSRQDYKYSPVGIDCIPLYSNVLAGGVFSNLSILVFYSKFSSLVPDCYWTKYQLSDTPIMLNPNKKVFPQVGFDTGDDAINITKRLLHPLGNLSMKHEEEALLCKQYILKAIRNE